MSMGELRHGVKRPGLQRARGSTGPSLATVQGRIMELGTQARNGRQTTCQSVLLKKRIAPPMDGVSLGSVPTSPRAARRVFSRGRRTPSEGLRRPHRLSHGGAWRCRILMVPWRIPIHSYARSDVSTVVILYLLLFWVLSAARIKSKCRPTAGFPGHGTVLGKLPVDACNNLLKPSQIPERFPVRHGIYVPLSA
jgi:hypothetical protein